jgi:cobalt/nickel transport system ATP-binding protein
MEDLVNGPVRAKDRLAILADEAAPESERPVAALSGGAPVFELDDVSFSYEKTIPALEAISLHIPRGGKVGIVGANGSGKSTLLRILGGIYFPNRGCVRFDGRELSERALDNRAFHNEFRRRVGMIFQNPDSQLFNPTVWDELLFGPGQTGMPQAQALERANALLSLFRIEKLRSRHPWHLSGGEKKKALLAAVLMTDPEVLILDEPTANLDPRSSLELTDYLDDLDEQGKTLILATHDMHTIFQTTDTLVILSEGGRILAKGKTEEVMESRDLLEKANLVHVHRHRHGDSARDHRHTHGHFLDHRHTH